MCLLSYSVACSSTLLLLSPLVELFELSDKVGSLSGKRKEQAAGLDRPVQTGMCASAISSVDTNTSACSCLIVVGNQCVILTLVT